MKTIPMGFDLRFTKTDVVSALRTIEQSGFIKAGFNYIVVPADDKAANYAVQIHEIGANAGIAASADWALANMDVLGGFEYVELDGEAQEACEKIQEELPKIFVTVVTDEESAKAGVKADAWRLDGALTDDFYDFTRNVLDSCLGTGAQDCNDYPSASRERAKIAEATKTYCIPALLPCIESFDKERLRAILSMYAILKAPLFLTTLPEEMTEEQSDMLLNAEWRRILKDEGPTGSALRYYDPWHGLFKRESADGKTWMLILNRCHGDVPTDIRSADLGLAENTDFVMHDVYENVAVESKEGIFDIHVETSDHPENPCCRLYEI